MTDELVGLVLNTNGLELAPAEDAEYVEVPQSDRLYVIEATLSGDDEAALDEAVRHLNVAALVAVYDAARALMWSTAAWNKRAAERMALAKAIDKVAQRG